MVLKEEQTRSSVLEKRLRKYLVTWTLALRKDELQQISMHPQVLNKGLSYVEKAAKRHNLKIYRIAELDEITQFKQPIYGTVSTTPPHGIAIIEVYSLEEAHELVNQWVEGLGFGFGAVSVRNYVEYKIEPLVDLSVGGKM